METVSLLNSSNGRYSVLYSVVYSNCVTSVYYCRGDEKGDGSDEDDEVVMRRAKVSAENSPAEPLALTGTRFTSFTGFK